MFVKTFHSDIIQGVVGKYSSEPFAVEVSFVDRGGQEYPVISVPTGVRTPAVAKADLFDADGKPLIKEHAVYVRSLSANNTVSSSEARRGDWEHLVRICFDNREGLISVHSSVVTWPESSSRSLSPWLEAQPQSFRRPSNG